MEYVEIYDESMIACQKNGRQYTYSFIDDGDEFSKVHQKSPLELSDKTSIGKEILDIIRREPISATSDKEREKKYLRRLDTILQSLQDNIDKVEHQEERNLEEEWKNLQYLRIITGKN